MLKINSTITRLDFLKRHLYNFLPYITIRKLFNIFLSEFEYKNSRSVLRSLPSYLKIEPTILCQLNCLKCPQPKVQDYKGNNPYLSMETLKEIIEPIYKSVLGVSFSFFGEPMLNRNLPELISYIHSKNIAVSYPSNFSLKLSDEYLISLIKSGLDSIMVSLDGASKETYEQYRIGGDFDLVLKNVKRLSELKNIMNSRKPRIIWKFVMFDNNKHEADIVKSTYQNHGFDSFEINIDFFSKEYIHKRIGENKNMAQTQKPCFWLWNTMYIRYDGLVLPCCNTRFDLGNVKLSNCRKIWNNEHYSRLRKGFDKKAFGKDMDIKCQKCIGTTKWPP